MSQDQKARQEIQSLYRYVVSLSEAVKTQQEKIQSLEEDIELLKDLEREDRIERGYLKDDVEKLESRLEEISEEQEEVEEALEQTTELEEGYVCPICGEKYEKVGSLSNHIGGKKDHDNVSSYFRKDGGYYNPVTGESFETSQKFFNSWRNLSTNATEYFVDNYSDLKKKKEDDKIVCPACGDVFDTEKGLRTHAGNTSKHPNISDYFRRGGEYLNPVTGESFEDYTDFKVSWQDLDYSMTDIWREDFGDLPANRG